MPLISQCGIGELLRVVVGELLRVIFRIDISRADTGKQYDFFLMILFITKKIKTLN